MADRYKHIHRQSQAHRRKTKMCLSKAAYETQEAAFQKGQRSYKCRHCDKWHRSGQLNSLLAVIRKRDVNFSLQMRYKKKDWNYGIEAKLLQFKNSGKSFQ